MHETVLASSLLKIVQESVAQHTSANQDIQVTEVGITVGLLASLEPQTLRGCFEILAEDTIAANAVLAITTRPMKGLCPDCGAAVEITERHFACPDCGGQSVDWHGGQGMEITSIRVVEKKHPPEGEKSE